MVDTLVELPLGEAIDASTTLLQQTHQILPVSTQLLERLRQNLDDEIGARQILKVLVAYGAPNPALTDQLLELLDISECPREVIETVAALAGNKQHELEKIIVAFQEFMRSAEEDLWLSIIGPYQNSSYHQKNYEIKFLNWLRNHWRLSRRKTFRLSSVPFSIL